MFAKIFLILLLSACSTAEKKTVPTASLPPVATTPKEFARGELILGTQLLTKIFDQEMAPLECVPDRDEAELLLRTIRPRMEVVQDDLEAMLDNNRDIEELVNTCNQNCTCAYIDELFREHQVTLTQKQRKLLMAKKSEKEISRCLNFVQTTFCQSELFKTLDKEKGDFSFEEAP